MALVVYAFMRLSTKVIGKLKARLQILLCFPDHLLCRVFLRVFRDLFFVEGRRTDGTRFARRLRYRHQSKKKWIEYE